MLMVLRITIASLCPILALWMVVEINQFGLSINNKNKNNNHTNIAPNVLSSSRFETQYLKGSAIFATELDDTQQSTTVVSLSQHNNNNDNNNNNDDDDHDDHDDDDDDPLMADNLSRLRKRPRNLKMVFMGDSITRYQYLSLTYWLRHGSWFDPNVLQNHLVDAHSFHHWMHPNEDWNEFFSQTNRLLWPLERCDCWRKQATAGNPAVERRYFYDRERNNTVVYLNLNGNETLGYGGHFGRLQANAHLWTDFRPGILVPAQLDQDVHGYHHQKSSFTTTDNNETTAASSSSLTSSSLEPPPPPAPEQAHGLQVWNYSTWDEVVRYHVAKLSLGAGTPVILNAGLHQHDLHETKRAVALKEALEDAQLMGIWKTTTLGRPNQPQQQQHQQNSSSNHTAALPQKQHDGFDPEQAAATDRLLCATLGRCFNTTWTAHLQPHLYFDAWHFREPVYRILNEELLNQLGVPEPAGYLPLSRTHVLLIKQAEEAGP